MSHKPDVSNSGNLDSLPSWISDHLGEGSSYMTDEVNQSPASPMEDLMVAIHPSVEEKNNIMTLKELDSLRESYSFPPGVQVRLPKEGETIISARQGEVAFYEAVFPIGLRFPIHPTIRSMASETVGEERPEGGTLSSSCDADFAATHSPRPGEGTSVNLSTVLGPTASILGNPFMAEKLLRGVIPLANKGKVDKLTLDQTTTKLLHMIVLESSLVVQSREAWEHASLQEGQVASTESEVSRLQKLSGDLEQQLAKAQAREQQAIDELAKMKNDQDSFADKFERSGVLVVELRKALDKAKDSTIEEFKSSSESLVPVEDAASKYFGKGFDFCKGQLHWHHPALAINLEDMALNQDLLAKEDEAEEEKEKKMDNYSLSDDDLMQTMISGTSPHLDPSLSFFSPAAQEDGQQWPLRRR
ncbi:hypothetical protein Acr_00g0043180 [Actinidia rufa]|uniref:Uncharacterized protein n=1 Tax=Actinidia rufa TaxID=165716 RepID=A0A7J0DIY2_9ERIC|nr:hypothetical protein Acr_00g0043180 [Actinidia rufa]